MQTIADNVRLLRERIAAAAERAGAAPESVSLVAAAKTRTPAEIRAAVEAGIEIVGENRVQEAEPKIAELAGLDCAWHMVGHLQRNKAGKALRLFDLLQSLDSRRLADELQKRAAAAGKIFPVLVEVNTSGEETKYGVSPEEAPDFVAYVASRANLGLEGLMTVGPLAGGPEAARAAFRTLRRLFEKTAPTGGASFRYLSMGMTEDFELAIEEGSNMVRVGRAIFGPR
ncbi:MAG: YggS family pyridoxal phosphate-dependent enzyme [Candidatus Coatesbacteria bacterium]|nr:MAG: YggS family pyridoxal phosphate-dependent enzyme [Candidatus Coatesbacteria bacterium]